MTKQVRPFNLEAIIGSVSKTHNHSQKSNNKKELNNSEYETYEVNGLKIKSKFKKVGESFKIKPHLKQIVEDVVQEAHKCGYNVSKGEIYNLLIEIGLKSLKNNGWG